ncbi:hypothetical protein [Sorangium sp. So ce693]|uniref:hypothetical protein n=1 Tax=Sorangium sp. So ce693 TaxID=3133318 RepID=UPI003F5E06FA
MRSAALALLVGAALGTFDRPADAGPRTSSLAWVRMSSDVREAPGSPAFSLAYGRLSVCPIEIARGRTALSGCAGAMLGSLRVEGLAVPSRFRHERLVFDLSLDTRVRRRFVGPLFGAVGLGIAVPTVQNAYFYTDAAGAQREIFSTASSSTSRNRTTSRSSGISGSRAWTALATRTRNSSPSGTTRRSKASTVSAWSELPAS